MLNRRTLISALPSALAITSLGFPALVRAAPTRTIGLTLPLTGVQASVGREMKEAYELAFATSKAPFKLRFLDDESKADIAAENIKSLCADPTVVAASGIVGTPHAQACAPIAAEAGLPLVGIRSGAQSLRSGNNTIWHLRASFEEELTYIVRDAKGRSNGGLVVVFSDDSFGKSSKDWMLSEMKRMGVKEVLTLSVDREGTQVVDVCQKVAAALDGMQEMPSIALLMITKPMIAATKELRLKHRVVSPILAMSFTANSTVTSEQDKGLVGLGVIIAFPLPRTSRNTASTLFCTEVTAAGKEHLVESLTSYEAWFYAKTLTALAGAEKREDAVARLSRPLPVPGLGYTAEFDTSKVGFRFLGMAYKATNGKMRAI